MSHYFRYKWRNSFYKLFLFYFFLLLSTDKPVRFIYSPDFWKQPRILIGNLEDKTENQTNLNKKKLVENPEADRLLSQGLLKSRQFECFLEFSGEKCIGNV